eukprot:TRINITY_DN8028_c0_g1_i2.p1 TRINITY_DN8028_c0_g1~~TRINITY_DN8028_c0_g1_i2.p1  ORF type:complete len:358 (+),score=32.12 TRINITY_DN8028_c0_g1_i2:3-1076(+)
MMAHPKQHSKHSSASAVWYLPRLPAVEQNRLNTFVIQISTSLWYQLFCIAIDAICRAHDETLSDLTLPGVVIVASSPRSGSTWLLDLLAGAYASNGVDDNLHCCQQSQTQCSSSDFCHMKLRHDRVELYCQGEVLNPAFGNYGNQRWMTWPSWTRWLQHWRSWIHWRACLATPCIWRRLASALTPLQVKLFHTTTVVPVVKVFQEQLDYHDLKLHDLVAHTARSTVLVLYRQTSTATYRSLVKAFSTNQWCNVANSNTCVLEPGETYRQSYHDWIEDETKAWERLLTGFGLSLRHNAATEMFRMKDRQKTLKDTPIRHLSYEDLKKAPSYSVKDWLRLSFPNELRWTMILSRLRPQT